MYWKEFKYRCSMTYDELCPCTPTASWNWKHPKPKLCLMPSACWHDSLATVGSTHCSVSSSLLACYVRLGFVAWCHCPGSWWWILLHKTSPGEKSKFKVQFLLNGYHMHAIVKPKNLELNVRDHQGLCRGKVPANLQPVSWQELQGDATRRLSVRNNAG